MNIKIIEGEEPKNDLPDDVFESRLSNEIIKKKDYKWKSINEYYKLGEEIPDEFYKAFSVMADVFRNNDRVDPNGVHFLYQQWDFPKNIIDIIWNEFGWSYDESNKFLMIMDGCDGTDEERIREAWETYSEENDIHTGGSTDDFNEIITI